MQRLKVQSRREPDVLTRCKTMVWACTPVPYAHVQTRVHVCGRQTRPLEQLPFSPTWPGCPVSSRRRPPALVSLTPASTRPRSPFASASHVHSAGGVSKGGGEGGKHSPGSRSESLLMLVPVVARDRRAARAARRPAKHNTWLGQWMGGRHQRGDATGSAEHLQTRWMRSSGRR